MTKKCSNCQNLKPPTSFHRDNHLKSGYASACKECRNLRSRHHHANNKDHYKRVRQRWYAANRTRVLARKRAASHANQKVRQSYLKQWYNANRERAKDQSRRWKAANPDKVRLISQRGSRMRKVRCGPKLRTVEWLAILAKVGWQCLYCGSASHPLVIEHFVPISRLGWNTHTNILPACGPCNRAKQASDPYRWIPEAWGYDTLQRAVEFLGV